MAGVGDRYQTNGARAKCDGHISTAKCSRMRTLHTRGCDPVRVLGVFGYGYGNILAPVRRSEARYCSPAGYRGRGQTNGGRNGEMRDRDEIASTHTCRQDARIHVSTTEQHVGFQGYRQSLDLEVVAPRGGWKRRSAVGHHWRGSFKLDLV